MKNTSRIGTIGELAVASHLLSQGYDVFKDISGSAPVDLVSFKDNVFTRIQVKCVTTHNGTVTFKRFVSGREIKKQLKGDEFDVMALYVRDKNICLYARLSEIVTNVTGISVRLEAAKNGAHKNIRWFESYVRM